MIQTLPARVTFTQGQEALACMRLSENGLIRWYTACCNTPIGNTLPNFQMSFIGLVHSCLESTGGVLDRSFGPVRMRINTKSAKGEVKSNSGRATWGILRVLAMVARARIDGSYKRTALFSVDTRAPIVAPKVLNRSERDDLMKAV